MRIRTVEKLSEHREFTPEGYLLCRGAALARTGVMRYLPEEVEPELMQGTDKDEALLYRDENEVFSPLAMASFEGKPLTIDHPDEDVDPENWRELAKGMVLNVRRGAGAESDLLLADILVTDAGAINMIREGAHELSCGYDTKLEIIRPGIGRQTQIRGNHVALVERGRAGARCRIKDMPVRKPAATPRMNKVLEEKMARKSLFDKLRKLLSDAEAEESAQGKEETPQPATDADIQADLQEIKLMLRTLLEGLKPAGDEEPVKDENGAEPENPAQDEETGQDEEPAQDEETTDDCPRDDAPEADEEPDTKDSLPSRFCDARMVSQAKRLGLTGARIGDSADAVRRSALGIAMRDSETARICREILGNAPLSTASSRNVRAAFLAVSAIRGSRANRRAADALTEPGNGVKGPVTPAQINKMNAQFYGGK